MTNDNGSGDVNQVLGLEGQPTGRQRVGLWLAAFIGLALIITAAIYLTSGNGTAVQFKTAEARSGNLTVTVTATGALEPVNQVEVGTEISGTVRAVETDFNDRVTVGQVLARLDTDQLEAKARQSQASLELAQARVEEAKATVVETRNKWRRTQKLAKQGLSSQEDTDAAEAAYARAKAELGVAEAQVTQAQAQLDSDRTALAKAVIRSPINGIVLSRNVEPGQTVAASFQTPVLFTLAENLAQMELHVAMDEADVGQVKEGQQATFTVDAYPDRTFPALVTQVRYAPQTVEGVVTYGTVLNVDNSDLSLRPGMTATAEITVQTIEGALLIPNAALRFTPPVTEKATNSGRSLLSRLFPRPAHRTRERVKTDNKRQRVWVLRNGQPVSIAVTTGATDGVMTQVREGEVTAGMALLVDTISKGS